MKLLVRTVNLHKSFPRGRGEIEILHGVNLDFATGEFVAVVGPSGCGKSTLLHLLGGLASPTAGEVFIDGEDITAMNGSRRTRFLRERIGFVFQRFNLLPSLSAYDNVRLALSLRGNGEARGEVNEILSVVGLSGKSDHRPSELSMGEEQRVAIARAIVGGPKLLLADEPTGNLDSQNARTVLELFRKIHGSGTTIVMVTHNEELSRSADRVVSMRDGRLL